MAQLLTFASACSVASPALCFAWPGFTLVDCPTRSSKETLDKKLLVDMMHRTMLDFQAQVRPVICLITSDGDYAYALQRMRDVGARIVLMHKGFKRQTPDVLLYSAHRVLHWTLDVMSPDASPPKAALPPPVPRAKLSPAMDALVRGATAAGVAAGAGTTTAFAVAGAAGTGAGAGSSAAAVAAADLKPDSAAGPPARFLAPAPGAVVAVATAGAADTTDAASPSPSDSLDLVGEGDLLAADPSSSSGISFPVEPAAFLRARSIGAMLDADSVGDGSFDTLLAHVQDKEGSGPSNTAGWAVEPAVAEALYRSMGRVDKAKFVALVTRAVQLGLLQVGRRLKEPDDSGSVVLGVPSRSSANLSDDVRRRTHSTLYLSLTEAGQARLRSATDDE